MATVGEWWPEKLKLCQANYERTKLKVQHNSLLCKLSAVQLQNAIDHEKLITERIEKNALCQRVLNAEDELLKQMKERESISKKADEVIERAENKWKEKIDALMKEIESLKKQSNLSTSTNHQPNDNNTHGSYEMERAKDGTSDLTSIYNDRNIEKTKETSAELDSNIEAASTEKTGQVLTSVKSRSTNNNVQAPSTTSTPTEKTSGDGTAADVTTIRSILRQPIRKRRVTFCNKMEVKHFNNEQDSLKNRRKSDSHINYDDLPVDELSVVLDKDSILKCNYVQRNEQGKDSLVGNDFTKEDVYMTDILSDGSCERSQNLKSFEENGNGDNKLDYPQAKHREENFSDNPKDGPKDCSKPNIAKVADQGRQGGSAGKKSRGKSKWGSRKQTPLKKPAPKHQAKKTPKQKTVTQTPKVKVVETVVPAEPITESARSLRYKSRLLRHKDETTVEVELQATAEKVEDPTCVGENSLTTSKPDTKDVSENDIKQITKTDLVGITKFGKVCDESITEPNDTTDNTKKDIKLPIKRTTKTKAEFGNESIAVRNKRRRRCTKEEKMNESNGENEVSKSCDIIDGVESQLVKKQNRRKRTAKKPVKKLIKKSCDEERNDKEQNGVRGIKNSVGDLPTIVEEEDNGSVPDGNECCMKEPVEEPCITTNVELFEEPVKIKDVIVSSVTNGQKDALGADYIAQNLTRSVAIQVELQPGENKDTSVVSGDSGEKNKDTVTSDVVADKQVTTGMKKTKRRAPKRKADKVQESIMNTDENSKQQQHNANKKGKEKTKKGTKMTEEATSFIDTELDTVEDNALSREPEKNDKGPSRLDTEDGCEQNSRSDNNDEKCKAKITEKKHPSKKQSKKKMAKSSESGKTSTKVSKTTMVEPNKKMPKDDGPNLKSATQVNNIADGATSNKEQSILIESGTKVQDDVGEKKNVKSTSGGLNKSLKENTTSNVSFFTSLVDKKRTEDVNTTQNVKKRKVLLNNRQNSILMNKTNGLFQETLPLNTTSSTSGMSRSLTTFMKAFIVPKLKK